MNRLAKLIIVAIAVCGSIVAASATSTAAEPACPVGKFDHQLKWDGQSCIDPTALSAKDQDVLDAKSAAAKTYSAYLGGASTSNAVTAADAAVQAKSGATLVTPKSANSIAPDSLSGYTPTQQINSYYCGPASAMSLLYYFGTQRNSAYMTSATYDTVTGVYDQMNGDRYHDQPMFANYFWLATDNYGYTPWGDAYMPFTLRAWRGDSYYQQLPTSSMTQAIEYSDISYDTDRQFPVVENVLYNSSSYYPSGFNPGLQYQHFDTLSGHFDVGGVSYVEQGQVYGSPGYTYVAYQTFTLATQWSAVAQWHGIVW
jgi:hypothetical protein